MCSSPKVFLWALVMGPYSDSGGSCSIAPALLSGAFRGFKRIVDEGSIPRAQGLDCMVAMVAGRGHQGQHPGASPAISHKGFR